jgi:hypothetical protein
MGWYLNGFLSWATGTVVLPLYRTSTGTKAFPLLTMSSIPNKHPACLNTTWDDYYSHVANCNELYDGIYMATWNMGNWFSSTATVPHVHWYQGLPVTY